MITIQSNAEPKSGIGTYICRDCLKSKKYLRAERCVFCAHANRWTKREEHVKTSMAVKKYFEIHPDAREKQNKILKNYWQDLKARQKQSKVMKRLFEDARLHEKYSKAQKKRWNNPGNLKERQKMSETVKNRFEHNPAIWMNVSGPNSHFWRRGTSLESYGGGFTPRIKRRIRKRDDYLCQKCYLGENGHSHDIHHIDFTKENNSSNNLITLCHSCHSKTNRGSRDYWMGLYQGIQELRGIPCPT